MSTFGKRNSRIQTSKAAPKTIAPAKVASIPGMEPDELRAMLWAETPEPRRKISFPIWYRLLVPALFLPLMFAMLNAQFAHRLGMTTCSAQHILMLFTFVNLAMLNAFKKPAGERADTAVRALGSQAMDILKACAVGLVALIGSIMIFGLNSPLLVVTTTTAAVLAATVVIATRRYRKEQ